MANPEHLKMFLQGPKIWNEWKRENPGPDLSGSDLLGLVFGSVDLTSPLFISYNHSDAPFVDAMEAHLNERGVRFWRDNSSLDGQLP
jgi:hypothetical protein